MAKLASKHVRHYPNTGGPAISTVSRSLIESGVPAGLPVLCR